MMALSQKEFARVLGTTSNIVGNWEREEFLMPKKFPPGLLGQKLQVLHEVYRQRWLSRLKETAKQSDSYVGYLAAYVACETVKVQERRESAQAACLFF